MAEAACRWAFLVCPKFFFLLSFTLAGDQKKGKKLEDDAAGGEAGDMGTEIIFQRTDPERVQPVVVGVEVAAFSEDDSRSVLVR